MENKSLRDKLQAGIYVIINPFVKFLIKIGLTPNGVTMIGLLLNIGVAIIFIQGAEKGNRNDLSYIGWAGALVLFAGLFDMLDGQVARIGKMSSRFGAMFDSVLDRYSELVTFLGICFYLVSHHYFLSSLFAFIALVGSMMVSYTRARAEGLGIECKGGLMQRPERVVLIGISAMLCGITGSIIGGDYKLFIPGISFHVFESMSIFTIPITIMAVLTNITAVNRLLDAKKALDARDAENAAAIKNSDKKAGTGINPVVGLFILIFSLTALFSTPGLAEISKNKAISLPQDTFPIPKNTRNLLFYVQRTPNTNTILYELNILKNNILDVENPVNINWIRYTEKKQREGLSYIQRKFAYGLNVKSIGKEKYELRFVSYEKLPLYLMRSAKDNNYYVFAKINEKLTILKRVFVKIEGGTFWVPNVVYVELKGQDPDTGKEVVTRFKP